MTYMRDLAATAKADLLESLRYITKGNRSSYFQDERIEDVGFNDLISNEYSQNYDPSDRSKCLKFRADQSPEDFKLLLTKEFLVEGCRHSTNDSPSIIRYSIKRNQMIFRWHCKGLRHRTNGPYYIDYNVDSDQVQHVEWCINDKSIPTKIINSWLDNNGIDRMVPVLSKDESLLLKLQLKVT